ncbi:MAG: pyruvate formate lyase-activating protein [Eubacterium sp.]|nr:pyruvate formate lyase-activating protein [Eubacterium sp.]
MVIIMGKIHSIETFGTVDGPGVRFVVFFQGCPMRCKFCHNPDTWKYDGGTEMSVEEIYEKFDRNRAFYKNGGITATGGEPLVQLEFLTELFECFKANGVNTCLDTSGICYTSEKRAEFERLLKSVDLVMLDIKSPYADVHKELTGQDMGAVVEFAKLVSETGTPLRIRHVVVPGITDSEESLMAVGKLISQFRTLKELEVLPYHKMGIKKYEEMGISYPLGDLEPFDKEKVPWARQKIIEGIKHGKD